MSGLEVNKIVGAVLAAGVLAMGVGFIGNQLTHRETLPEATLHAAATAAVATPAEAPEEAPGTAAPEPVLPLLASADPAAGEKLVKKCTSCHTLDEGGAKKVGPNLWNIVDRAIASGSDFSYSGALQEKASEAWSYQNLNLFLAKPKDWAKGTKMSFAGIKKAGDRANLIAYLRTLSASPAPLPAPEEAAAEAPAEEAPEVGEQVVEESAAEAPEPAPEAAEPAAEAPEPAAEAAAEAAAAVQEAAAPAGVGALVAAASAEAGQKVARKCKACHSFDKGGPKKIGPALWNIVGRGIAGAEGFKYSGALSGMSGNSWSLENLDAFIAKPKEFAPGTKMTFAGISKEGDRAALLAYLRSLSDNPVPLPE
jgi:cytochrome c